MPYPQHLFKYIPPPKLISPSSLYTNKEEEPVLHALCLHRACGGRWLIDKCLPASQPIPTTTNAAQICSFCCHLHGGDSDDGNDEERAWRLAERWKFDEDDSPAVGPEGPDEQDHVLLDDYEPRFD